MAQKLPDIDYYSAKSTDQKLKERQVVCLITEEFISEMSEDFLKFDKKLSHKGTITPKEQDAKAGYIRNIASLIQSKNIICKGLFDEATEDTRAKFI